MTKEKQDRFLKITTRLAKLGALDPTEQILALDEECEVYRAKIHCLETQLEMIRNINHLLEQDITDRDKMLESKVEEVYAVFMQDYKAMREELESVYEPKKPRETDAYPHRLYCPACFFTLAYNKENLDSIKANQQYNYCPACGQALDWSEEEDDQ